MNAPHSPELKPQGLEFESMNLQVGGRVQFITHRGIKPTQHFSTVIGYVKDEYIILKIPMENGAPIPLTDGEKVTVRVFSGVTVCFFDCTVERVFARPLLYVHLSFPNKIEGTSLRGAMRVKVEIPVEISGTRDGAVRAKGTVVNLSVTGALVESPSKLSLADGIVNLQFTLLAQPGNYPVLIDTKANIRNVNSVLKPGTEQEVFTYGMQFVDLSPPHYTLLQNVTYEALIADRQKIV